MQRHLAAVQEPGHQTGDLAQIQLRPRRARGSEGDAQELQPRQGLGCAGGHDLERIGAHGGVALVLQDFEPVHHGP
jgi:hypothetical protein